MPYPVAFMIERAPAGLQRPPRGNRAGTRAMRIAVCMVMGFIAWASVAGTASAQHRPLRTADVTTTLPGLQVFTIADDRSRRRNRRCLGSAAAATDCWQALYA